MFTKEIFLKEFPNGVKGIIFDCDGVIIDSKFANITYYNLVREAIGLPLLTEDQENYVHMCSGAEALAYVIPEALRHNIKNIVNQMDYETKVAPYLSLHENVKENLLKIKDAGIKVGMHTNRSNGIYALLEDYALENVFEPIMHCQIVKTKPDSEGVFKILDVWQFDPSDVMFVGDSEADLYAARGASVKMLAFQNQKLDSDLGFVDSYDEFAKIVINK